MFGTLGVPRVLNSDDCRDTPVVTGPIASEAFDFPSKDTLLANVATLKSQYPGRSPVVIKLYLDDFKQLERRLTGAGIIQALEAFGIQVHKEEAALLWGSNHTKIASNERRAVVSGGNIVDKVMDWIPQKHRWREAAILVEGELVHEEEQAAMTAEGRLVWSSNFDVKETPTWKALGTIISKAQHSLYFENAFFSDGGGVRPA